MLNKFNKIALMVILFVVMCFVTPTVKAISRTVNDQDELKSALADTSVDTIILGSDIDTTEKINITRPIYLDGKNHTIKYVGTFGDEENDFTVWAGIYVLQVYKTEATIKDIKLTGGNAALLINGSVVKLEGKIDVSGNGFGGIELGKGANVEETPRADLDSNTEIVNETESEDRPSLWVPSDTENAVVAVDGVKQILTAGEELTLNEIEDLFEVTENPKTNDSILVVMFGAVLALLTLKFKKEA